ncbi:MAG: methionine--tRNA ligase [Tissierellia bacterium]|nr:methionine--tRNA ligase [Tissierellia bacterium]
MGKNFYLTTPIYYPNSNLHIGHTYTTIVADTLKRFKEIQGYDVFFTTGTDEHGQKLLEAAQKAGKEPLEYIDPIVDSAKDLWKKLDIKYDAFVRSTGEQHAKNVQAIYQKLYDKGDIYKSSYNGHYCVSCESFFTESQLEDGKCPDCGRDVRYHEEESYFFRLSKYQDRLEKLYRENPDFIQPESRKNEMLNNFFKEGLEDLSVSRNTFDWGVKLPFDESHIAYVWIDALSCYLTGIGYRVDEEKFNKYWPADVHFVGKEIVRFHAIIWPAILMALDLPLPKKIFGHGWILFDNDKMSKSKGNVYYPEPIIDLYGIDTLKYYVLREFTFGADGNFTAESFLKRINSDLANDLGNLVSRTTSMVEKYCDGIVPEPMEEVGPDAGLKEIAVTSADEVSKLIDDFNFSNALERIWKLIRRTNKYIDETEPWVLGREEGNERLKTVLYNLVESLRIIGILISPILSESAGKIFDSLGDVDKDWESSKTFGRFKAGNKVKKGENLFPRLDVPVELERLLAANEALMNKRLGIKPAEEDKVEAKAEVDYSEFEKMEFKVAHVDDCKLHPDADKLLVFSISIGEEKRTIVSGIREWYSPEDLIGKKIMVITNLKKRKIRGIESHGMLLAAEDKEGRLSVLTPLSDVDSGADIS